MYLGKDQSFHKGIIFMVPKPKLGDNSIYTSRHGPPYAKVHFLWDPKNSSCALAPIVTTPLGIKKFDSNVFHLLILIKAFNIVYTHFHLVLCPFAMVGD